MSKHTLIPGDGLGRKVVANHKDHSTIIEDPKAAVANQRATFGCDVVPERDSTAS